MNDGGVLDEDAECVESADDVRTNAQRRIAKRRARHARAVARKLHSSAPAAFIAIDSDEDHDEPEADPGAFITKVARETEEAFRRESEAFANVERQAVQTYLKLAREAIDSIESNTLAIARERERARRERATESRYQFRRDMLDDAEASGDANDVLVQGWNDLLLLLDDAAERVDCVALHDRFVAHVRACRRALEPKESLARRLKAFLIAEVDATFDATLVANSGALAEAARVSANARAQRESVASSALRDSSNAFIETLRLRNRTRALALSKVDQLIDDEARARAEQAEHAEVVRRSSLTSLVLENANALRCLRDDLDHRLEETRSALHLALASAPLNYERFKDALRRRVGEEANRRGRARAADRALKNVRMELMDAKRRHAETATACAELEERLQSGVRTSYVRLDVARRRVDGEDNKRCILELKHAQIEKLHRQLHEIEAEIFRTVLHARAVDTRSVPVRVRALALEALETVMRTRDDSAGVARSTMHIVTHHSLTRATRCA